MTALALAVASALLALCAAVLFAVRARDAERAVEDCAASAAVAWREAELARAELRETAERLRAADAALRAADREIAVLDAELSAERRKPAP